MLLTFFTFINNQAQILDMIVDIEKLSVDYSGVNALEEISFGIDDGDFLGIIGPNGAGKSTLFRCMLGLHTQYDGIIKFFGHNIKNSKKYLSQIGYVPQKPVVDKNFPATIREIVSMSQNSNDSKKVEEALQKVWMHELADRRIGDYQLVNNSVYLLQRLWSTHQKF